MKILNTASFLITLLVSSVAVHAYPSDGDVRFYDDGSHVKRKEKIVPDGWGGYDLVEKKVKVDAWGNKIVKKSAVDVNLNNGRPYYYDNYRPYFRPYYRNGYRPYPYGPLY